MKSGWMRLVRAAAVLALAGGLWAPGVGAAEVKNVKAVFLWPWTNAVGIEWEVEGEVATKSSLAVVASALPRTQMGYIASASALSGDTSLQKGTHAEKHNVLWNLEKQPIRKDTRVSFMVAYFPESYCVVDLSGGINAPSYPVTYLDAPPSGGFNTDAYKTTKLVLRRVDEGTFTMGSSKTPYQVTLTKPFYVGLFEVTQKQWTLVMGSNPSLNTGDMRPVEGVSYNMIRGSSAGANWPGSNAVDASSFLGKLRAKTGLEFDLPTEAQWEYACRAGTTTGYNNGGSNSDNMAYLGRYHRSAEYGMTAGARDVGNFTANACGLYDMHGNVCELCLDWYGELSAGTDPEGPSSGSNRVKRGGGWYTESWDCGSSNRDSIAPSDSDSGTGFRLVSPLSE